jgi:DNA repair exonuclease SbcCD ATPase subunit
MTRARDNKSKKFKPIHVGEELRQLHPWLEESAKDAKEKAIQKRRREYRSKGPELAQEEFSGLLDELEKIQQEINKLETRHEDISKKLFAHWGYTGIETAMSPLGETLFGRGFKLTLDADRLMDELSEAEQRKVSIFSPDPVLLLELCAHHESLQKVVQKAVRASVKINITPPSSRRPKSSKKKMGAARNGKRS